MSSKKQPSKYNVYMKKTMTELRNSGNCDDMDHKQLFKMAAGMWKESHENPANA